MKKFKEYLAEAKKTFDFKIKIAGDVPENFESNFKNKFETLGILEFCKSTTTPVQHKPIDFPLLSNVEITSWDLSVEYPITTPRLLEEIKMLGLSDGYVKVLNKHNPSEEDFEKVSQETKTPKLLDGYYTEEPNPDNTHYHGEKFVMDFLKTLEAESCERKKQFYGNIPSEKGEPNGL